MKQKNGDGIADKSRSHLARRTQKAMVRQADGNFARTFDAGEMIGIDRVIRQATSVVTIITAPNGDFVTMFPGVP